MLIGLWVQPEELRKVGGDLFFFFPHTRKAWFSWVDTDPAGGDVVSSEDGKLVACRRDSLLEVQATNSRQEDPASACPCPGMSMAGPVETGSRLRAVVRIFYKVLI